MSVNRPSRGVPLPSIWQMLLVAAVVCVGVVLWSALPKRPPSQSELSAQGSIQKLQAVEALVARGSEAVPELTAMLSSGDPKARRMALHALGQLGEQASGALEAVRSALSDEDREARSNALWAFTRICPDAEDVWRMLALRLDDDDSGIREAATKFLDGRSTSLITFIARTNPNSGLARQLTPEENRSLIHAVLEMAHSDRAETRDLVIRIVASRDWHGDVPQVTEMLRSLLNDGDPAVRATAITQIAARGVAHVDEVRTRLHDADAKVVDAALGAAIWLGPEGEQAIPDLLSLVDTVPDTSLSRLLNVLRYHKSCAAPALPGLVRRVVALDPVDDGVREDDPGAMARPLADDVRQRFSIVTDLLELGGDPHALLPVLKPFVASRRTELAIQWAGLLKRFDPDGARQLATKLIGDIENDPNRDRDSPCVKSLQILSGLGPTARDAVPLLVRLVEEDDRERPWIAWYAAAALGGIGPDAAPAVACLIRRIERAKTGDETLVPDEVLVSTLGRIGPAARSAVPVVLEILDQISALKPNVTKPGDATTPAQYAHVHGNSIWALGKIGDDSEAVLSRIRRELTIDSVSRRNGSALEALLLLSRNADAVPPELVSALDDESASMRTIAACLGEIRGDKTPAVPNLIAALDDEDPGVASAAALSLAEIGPPAIGAVSRLRDLAGDMRNRAPNRVRKPREYRLASFRFQPGDRDLGRLSLAEAARLALGTIDPNP